MQIKIFDILASASEQEVDVVNKFMRAHKVVDVDKQFYVADNVAHWSLCITYLLANPSQQQAGMFEKREKVDYKEVLSAEDFEKFAKLRALRKKLADDNAIPAYAVFTDAELAQIAQMPSIEASLLTRITGIGDKRVAKYGKLICEMYQNTSE